MCDPKRSAHWLDADRSVVAVLYVRFGFLSGNLNGRFHVLLVGFRWRGQVRPLKTRVTLTLHDLSVANILGSTTDCIYHLPCWPCG